VEREVATIVYTSSLLCKLRSLGPAEEGTEALAQLV
jgi:hypothetical protein